MKLHAFFSTDLGSLGSNAILLGAGGLVDWWKVRRGRKSGYSHMGLVFEGWAGSVYYESVWSVDPETHKTGVRGPKPLKDLLDWRDEVPAKRKVEFVEVPGCTEEEIARMQSRCEWAKQNIQYAKGQIFQNAMGFLFKRGIGLDRRTPRAWTCCEFFLRVLPARLAIEAFRVGDYLFDEYCPWGDRGPGVYQMVKKHQERKTGLAALGSQRSAAPGKAG